MLFWGKCEKQSNRNIKAQIASNRGFSGFPNNKHFHKDRRERKEKKALSDLWNEKSVKTPVTNDRGKIIEKFRSVSEFKTIEEFQICLKKILEIFLSYFQKEI